MMLTRSMRKSARAEDQEICQTDHARAAVRACGPRGAFCKGFVPWAHDRSIASTPRGDMKSLDLREIIEFIWFSYDFSKSARAGLFEQFGCENLRCLYVFVKNGLEIITKLMVFVRISTCARGGARMMTWMYFLQGFRALGA